MELNCSLPYTQQPEAGAYPELALDHKVLLISLYSSLGSADTEVSHAGAVFTDHYG
jgi:hypothetical protein